MTARALLSMTTVGLLLAFCAPHDGAGMSDREGAAIAALLKDGGGR